MIDKLSRLPIREQIGLAVALSVVGVMLVDAAVVKPSLRYLQALDADIAAAEAARSHAGSVLQYEDSVQVQYEEVKSYLGVSGPETETIEAFKNQLDEMAIEHGVQLRSMRHQQPEPTAYLVTYVIRIGEFEAAIPSFIRFLHAVSQAPGLMRVRQVTIQSQSEDLSVTGSFQVTKVMTLDPEQSEGGDAL